MNKRLDNVVVNTDKSYFGAMMWAMCSLEWVERFVFVDVGPKVNRDMPLQQLRNKAEVSNWAEALNVISVSLASRPVFFSSGVTSACFMSDETVADSSDRLTMLARAGVMMLMFVFSSAVGSREQDLRGHLFTSRMLAVAVVLGKRRW